MKIRYKSITIINTKKYIILFKKKKIQQKLKNVKNMLMSM